MTEGAPGRESERKATLPLVSAPTLNETAAATSKPAPSFEPARNGFTACLRRGVAACARRPLAAVGGFTFLALLTAGGLVVPWLNFPFLLLALAQLVAGFVFLSLRLIDDRRPRVKDLFAGFRLYERFLGLFWVGYVLTIFLAAPFLVGLWVDKHLAPASARPTVLMASGALALALQLVVLHRYLFVFHVAAEAPRGTSIAELGEESARLVAGRSLRLLGEAAALAALVAAGYLVYRAGWIVTLPVASCAFAARYRSLRPLSEA